MRLRNASPLFLLLAPSLISAQLPSSPLEQRDSIQPANRAAKDIQTEPLPEPVPSKQKSPSPSSRAGALSRPPYKGTEDAPVDGLDGKPHAGPFVDVNREDTGSKKGAAAANDAAKPRPTSLDKFAKTASSKDGWKLMDIPEKNDGVMNDENRPVPKKGTTGTEGGVTEKDKARKAQGPTAENKPQNPKEAPPLPHSEQKHIDEADQDKPVDKTKSATVKADTKDAVSGKPIDTPKKVADYDTTGGFGMEKPANLPEKPHNIPHPDPKVATEPGSGSAKADGPPVGTDKDTSTGTNSGSKWLVDTMPDTEGKTNPRLSKPDTPLPPAMDDDIEWHEWFHSFVLSFTMIIFSEIGDKTFLIAALMAMRHTRILVFSAALSALIAMTILSALLGHAFPTILPRRLTTLAAALLFFVFGARSLREGLAMPKHAGVGEELKEVEAELEEKEHDMARHRSRTGSTLSPYDLESARGRSPGAMKSHGGEPSPPISRSPTPAGRRSDRTAGLMNLLGLVLSPAWVQTFIMTFLGEWGDRSQISTIAMAAGQDYWWVTLGAIVGHACCTGLAVIGGRALAGRVSMRMGKFYLMFFFFPEFLVTIGEKDADMIFPSNHWRRPRFLGLRRYIPLRVPHGYFIDNAYMYSVFSLDIQNSTHQTTRAL